MVILNFILVISVLVLVHEIGHFLAARRAGIKVEEFGLGFPPRIWSKKIGETTYSLNALLLGGFVRLYGEDEAVDNERKRSFYFQGVLTRAGVIVAGVLMNFLLAVSIFSIFTWVSGFPENTGKVKIMDVADSSPAQAAGLRKGDVVVSVDGQSVHEIKDFQNLINQRSGEDTKLVLDRSGSQINFDITPRVNPPAGQGALGVAISNIEFVQPPFWKRPFADLWEGMKETWFWIGQTVSGLSSIGLQLVGGKFPQDVSGPVGIFRATDYSYNEGGFLGLFYFAGILSVNLALLNILPIPALDGGRLLFIVAEAIFGRRVLPSFEKYAHAVGMVLLLTLVLLITLHNDLPRIIPGAFNLLRTL